MNNLLYILCVISVIINIFIICYESRFLYRRVVRKISGINKIRCFRWANFNEFKNKVYMGSLLMCRSNKEHMKFRDHLSMVDMIIYKIYCTKNVSNKCNFYDAFLLNGILMYSQRIKQYNLDFLRKRVDDYYIKSDGSLKFRMKNITQITFGLVFIQLYQLTLDLKYKKCCDAVLDFVKQNLNNEYGIVIYDKNRQMEFVDTLGMICPFLFMYSWCFNDEESEKLANRQISNYQVKALESSSMLPFHAYDLKNGLKLGPINWGRGVGWYLLALAYGTKYSQNINLKKEYKSSLLNLVDLLNSCKNSHSIWNQFIGKGYQSNIDSSFSTMCVYSMLLADIISYSEKDILEMFGDLVDNKGFVMGGTGDTVDVNRYAFYAGTSELSQGFLISILSFY